MESFLELNRNSGGFIVLFAVIGTGLFIWAAIRLARRIKEGRSDLRQRRYEIRKIREIQNGLPEDQLVTMAAGDMRLCARAALDLLDETEALKIVAKTAKLRDIAQKAAEKICLKDGHDMDGCLCRRCGATRHEWGEGYICGRCGAVKAHEHEWETVSTVEEETVLCGTCPKQRAGGVEDLGGKFCFDWAIHPCTKIESKQKQRCRLCGKERTI